MKPLRKNIAVTLFLLLTCMVNILALLLMLYIDGYSWLPPAVLLACLAAGLVLLEAAGKDRRPAMRPLALGMLYGSFCWLLIIAVLLLMLANVYR